jgi:hypothetical protein
MKNRKKWETKSLQWIHKVREQIDEEIRRQSVTPAQWVRGRGKIDVESLCKKFGLQNCTIVKDRVKPRSYEHERTIGFVREKDDR